MNNGLIGIFKKIGSLKELKTKDKQNLVSSINEVVVKTETIKEKVDSSVHKIEGGLNYNTITITNNDGTTTDVVIKTRSGSGDSVNVFKTARSGGNFIATQRINTFTIENLNSTKEVDLIYNNLLLVRDVDYTIDMSTGVVGLSFYLEENEVVYYTVTDSSYDYNDLNNLPEIGNLQSLRTTSKEVVGAINEVDIKATIANNFGLMPKGDFNEDANTQLRGITRNTTATTNYPSPYGLTTTFNSSSGNDEGYLLQLHATTTSGKGLYYRTGEDSSISAPWIELAKKTDCVATKTSSSSDANSITENGVYHTWATITNLPNERIGNLFVMRGSSFVSQLYSEYTGRQWMRSRGAESSEWFEWKEVAFSRRQTLSLLNGFKIANSPGDNLVVSRNGDVCNIHGYITNSGIVSDGTIIVTLPSWATPTTLRRGYGVFPSKNSICKLDVSSQGGFVFYGANVGSNIPFYVDVTYTV